MAALNQFLFNRQSVAPHPPTPGIERGLAASPLRTAAVQPMQIEERLNLQIQALQSDEMLPFRFGRGIPDNVRTILHGIQSLSLHNPARANLYNEFSNLVAEKSNRQGLAWELSARSHLGSEAVAWANHLLSSPTGQNYLFTLLFGSSDGQSVVSRRKVFARVEPLLHQALMDEAKAFRLPTEGDKIPHMARAATLALSNSPQLVSAVKLQFMRNVELRETLAQVFYEVTWNSVAETRPRGGFAPVEPIVRQNIRKVIQQEHAVLRAKLVESLKHQLGSKIEHQILQVVHGLVPSITAAALRQVTAEQAVDLGKLERQTVFYQRGEQFAKRIESTTAYVEQLKLGLSRFAETPRGLIGHPAEECEKCFCILSSGISCLPYSHPQRRELLDDLYRTAYALSVSDEAVSKLHRQLKVENLANSWLSPERTEQAIQSLLFDGARGAGRGQAQLRPLGNFQELGLFYRCLVVEKVVQTVKLAYHRGTRQFHEELPNQFTQSAHIKLGTGVEDMWSQIRAPFERLLTGDVKEQVLGYLIQSINQDLSHRARGSRGPTSLPPQAYWDKVLESRFAELLGSRPYHERYRSNPKGEQERNFLREVVIAAANRRTPELFSTLQKDYELLLRIRTGGGS